MPEQPRKRQRHPLFDAPGARANYVRASQMSRMTIDEIVSYSMGFNPHVVNAVSIQPYMATSSKAQEFMHRRDVLSRATNDGELQAPYNWMDFIAFSEKRQIRLPAELQRRIGRLICFQAHEPRGGKGANPTAKTEHSTLAQDKDAHPRRYHSALKVLHAVAVKKYGHRSGQARSPAPTAMSGDTGDGRGRVSDDTVRSLLSEAEALIDGDTPN